MKKLILLFCMICFNVQGIEQDKIQSLLKKIHPNEIVRSHIESTLDLAKTLEPLKQNQLYTQLHRMLKYAVDLPLLKEGNFLFKQSHLIWMAAKTLKQEETLSIDDYQINFIYDEETGEKLAVFKSDGQRNHERMTWEIACIFGLENVFTPALPFTLCGYVGELQTFQTTDLTTEQSSDISLYSLVTYESYMKCALGVLLFALYDMHSENCYYQFCHEGYIQMGFWDTTYSESPSIEPPFSWIGWDFPQRERPISKRFKTILTKIINSWPKRIQMFQDYLNHPLTTNAMSNEYAEKLIERAKKLHHTILQHPDRPISEWHLALHPQYAKAKED